MPWKALDKFLQDQEQFRGTSEDPQGEQLRGPYFSRHSWIQGEQFLFRSLKIGGPIKACWKEGNLLSPSPPSDMGLATSCQATKWSPRLSCLSQINFLIIASRLLREAWAMCEERRMCTDMDWSTALARTTQPATLMLEEVQHESLDCNLSAMKSWSLTDTLWSDIRVSKYLKGKGPWEKPRSAQTHSLKQGRVHFEKNMEDFSKLIDRLVICWNLSKMEERFEQVLWFALTDIMMSSANNACEKDQEPTLKGVMCANSADKFINLEKICMTIMNRYGDKLSTCLMPRWFLNHPECWPFIMQAKDGEAKRDLIQSLHWIGKSIAWRVARIQSHETWSNALAKSSFRRITNLFILMLDMEWAIFWISRMLSEAVLLLMKALCSGPIKSEICIASLRARVLARRR